MSTTYLVCEAMIVGVTVPVAITYVPAVTEIVLAPVLGLFAVVYQIYKSMVPGVILVYPSSTILLVLSLNCRFP
jgi:hypothetical protein